MSMEDYNLYTTNATVRLIWSMADYISKKLSKVRIEFEFYNEGNVENDEMKGEELLRVKIINNSKEVRYVNEPKLKLSYKTCYGTNEVNLHEFNKSLNWPMELKIGSEVNISYLIRKEEIEYFLSNENKEKKCRIFVSDTSNKKYYSKKIKIKKLIDISEHNSYINKEEVFFEE